MIFVARETWFKLDGTVLALDRHINGVDNDAEKIGWMYGCVIGM